MPKTVQIGPSIKKLYANIGIDAMRRNRCVLLLAYLHPLALSFAE